MSFDWFKSCVTADTKRHFSWFVFEGALLGSNMSLDDWIISSKLGIGSFSSTFLLFSPVSNVYELKRWNILGVWLYW